METRSLKALSIKHLQGNSGGNRKETHNFTKETHKETIKETGGVSALSTWKPEPAAWLTPEGELRTRGVFDDLAEEIIKLTRDNLPLQRKLLPLHVGYYMRHPKTGRKEQ